MCNAEKFFMVAMGVLSIGALAAHEIMKPATEIVEYTKTIDRGDTLWSLCGEVADNTVHMQTLVYQTMEENGIKDPGDLQPGQVITIHVKKARDTVNGSRQEQSR